MYRLVNCRVVHVTVFSSAVSDHNKEAFSFKYCAHAAMHSYICVHVQTCACKTHTDTHKHAHTHTCGFPLKSRTFRAGNRNSAVGNSASSLELRFTFHTPVKNGAEPSPLIGR